ncbi:MAG TPA: hypothetical protein DEV73_01610 [Candidatus Zambryskibacteria bacterium]|uniref:Uncharacterized protein n=2 Tax=Candidatus Amesiibacteriota TaxID=1752730 RepID=A0A0G1SLH9_9BACT|nr:MAG: hypothetical protein UT95_C0003G0026 [Candidatus Curtissbacteria bacterium GW2011_GWB1_40_28]KKU29413.1 MAG: hypothetical protein UX42_C0001G0165 [Microgenomates group bacterium GW2011_GWC1_46_20]KKU70354.1 MAG: hypothetical protein UX92_C0001G0022 [Candidatus Amesbacteria bacterium GW2011_GWA1_47_20]KKU83642.1 MAG: hypothetical protein UY11_C0015G0005 [Candidatus Amesbacteria bacterium GW2011_GWC2_47_8]HCH59293.1 hypothetical protein [Candidatus Zambryskibacteria bacterium]
MLDVSSSPNIKRAKHWSSELNQLYRPTAKFTPESFDIVYSGDNLNTTRFTPVLLKEWFNLVAKDGYLFVDYRPNSFCDFQTLEENMLWLWKDKYEIIYHGLLYRNEARNLTPTKLVGFLDKQKNYYKINLDPITLLPPLAPTIETPVSDSDSIRFVCRKTQSTCIPGDEISKWTFGIITDGKRRDWMEEIIASIRAQRIPQYEIIVCGTYYDREEPDFIYIPFNQRRDKKWITRQKNLICERAKYENICILHNRLVLDKNWYSGMKKWGNCFEVLNVKQIQQNTGLLGNHWEYNYFLLYKKKSRFFNKIILQFTATLDPRDWYESIVMYGQSIVCKKHIYLEHKQNEALYWDWAEDHSFSFELINAGYIMRHNPYSLMYNLDSKNWCNNVRVVYSPVLKITRFIGPRAKLAYRWLIITLLRILKPYQLLTDL